MARAHQEVLADLEYLLNLNRYELKYRVTNNGVESRYQPDRFMHMLAGQMGQEQRGWMPCKHEGSAHVHLYALEREDEPAVAAVGHLSPSLCLFFARSLSSFEAPGIFPGSLLQPVYNRQQRARSVAAAAARNKTLF